MLNKILVGMFDDKRQTSTIMMGWLLIVMFFYNQSEPSEGSSFLQFGPHENTVIMGVYIDTWHKWGLVMIFTFINTCMNEFFSNSLDPWILNTIQDDKTKTIPYSKGMCMLLTQLYNVYCHLMSVVGISLLLSQVDVLAVRIIADVLVSTFAIKRFLRDKAVVVEEGIGYSHVDQEITEKCHCETVEPPGP